MSDTSTTSTGGVSGAFLLGITFVVLKLTGVIAWSWLWVLAPFWIPLALTLVILLGIVLVAAFKA